MKDRGRQKVISCDPGENSGLVLWEDRRPTHWEAIRISSRKGAHLLEDWFMLASELGASTMVVEFQYPRPGRGMKSLFGLAENRGAVIHLSRLHGFQVEKVDPQTWKNPVVKSLGIHFRSGPERKAKAIFDRAHRILGATPPSQDVADAVLLGHWFLNQGLYL